MFIFYPLISSCCVIALKSIKVEVANCAVYSGEPYLTIQGRGRSRAKGYLCLFLCLETYCCHLEMATTLETEALSAQGKDEMADENAERHPRREKQELVGQQDHYQLQRMTSDQGVTWHYNPPSAPHFGGVFEVMMIKSSKRAIYAILKVADITDEEL